jgi:DNA-binding LacI/PurR family transcriptional regulator
MSSVMVDNEAGGYAALEHLYKLGHRKIAFVRGQVKLSDSRERYSGMMRFAHEVELKINPSLVVDLPNALDPLSSFHQGYRLTNELLAMGKPFSAIAAFDDLTAFGVMRALREQGVRVPEECSVIGFDDVSHAALFSPGLTTVQQPMEEMGRIAAERVLRGIDVLAEETHEPKHDGHTLLVPTVLVRESTARRRK